jgi:hypothetical protein
MKMFYILLLGVTILQVYSAKKVIADETISSERLDRRIEAFNKWYEKLNPSTKVYAGKTNDHMGLGLFAKETLQVFIINK